MILVAITYISGEAQGCELTLAVAGWRRHFKEEFEILVVGDKPPVKNVGWLPLERVPEKEGQYRPCLDICNKLDAVCAYCKERGIANFIWASDDFFAVNDFTLDDVKFPKYLDDELPRVGLNHFNHFFRSQVKTRKLCEREGFGIMDWTTHLPMWLNAKKLHTIIEDYDMVNEGYIVENIYFNKHKPEGEPFKLCLNDRWKFGVYYQPLDKQGFYNALARKIWVCCSIRGWGDQLEAELRYHYRM